MDIHLDELTGRAQRETINTTRSSFVPLGQVAIDGEQLRVPYDKTIRKDALQVEDSHAGHLDPDEEDALYRYYDRTDLTSGAYDDIEVGRPIGGPTADPEGSGEDKGGRNPEKAMTRSEESLEVGRQRRETGRVRHRKYVVTEQVTQTVPVFHEEIRIEREPLSDADAGAAGAGAQIGEEETPDHPLRRAAGSAERSTPDGRVRLSKETVTGEATVSDEIRKEVIEPKGNDRVRASEHLG